MNKLDSLNNAIETAIRQARSLQNDGERILLLLTEEQPQAEYGFEADQVLPHTSNGRLVFPMGVNAKHQREYLISFDPSEIDDPSHPDPGVPVGWNWSIYGELKPPTMAIILTELNKEPAPTNIAMIPTERNLEENPLKGFKMLQLSAVSGHNQYAILIDPQVYNLQITNN